MTWMPKINNWANRVRIRLLERDGNLCWLCEKPFSNRKPPSIDHVIPKSKGGPTIISNLKLAHSKCNYERGDTGTMPNLSNDDKPCT